MSEKINVSEDNIKCKYGEIITTFKADWEHQDVYYDAESDCFLEARYHEEYLDTGTVYDGCFSISEDMLWDKLVKTCDEEGMRAYLKIRKKAPTTEKKGESISKDENQNKVKTLRNTAGGKIIDALYLAPFRYDEDLGKSIEDKYIHTSERASLKMKNIQSGTVYFSGCEDYSFAYAQVAEGVCTGKTMHLQTAVNCGHVFLPLFTDMETLQKIFGKNIRVGLFTWEDIVERLHDTVKNADGSYSRIEGIVFDPGVNNTVLSAEEVHEMNSKMNVHSAIKAIQESNSKVNESVNGFLCDEFDADIQRARRYCKASVILGVLSLPFGITFIPPVLAVIYGLIGRSKTGSQKEANDALAGIILGSLSIVITLWLLLSVF